MTDHVRRSGLVPRQSWRCLREWTLVRLAEGDGTSRQRRHLAHCEHCAMRHTAIVQARGTAAAVLRAAAWRFSPPGSAALDLPRPRRGRAQELIRLAAPLAVAAGLVVAFALGTHHATEIGSGAGAPALAADPSLDDVARSVFTIDDASVWLEADADDTRWEAALLGDRPCETSDGSTDPLCD